MLKRMGLGFSSDSIPAEGNREMKPGQVLESLSMTLTADLVGFCLGNSSTNGIQAAVI